MARFVPLRDNRHIRLLQLNQNQSPNDSFEGTLCIASLDDPGLKTKFTYLAVSYCWGDADHDSDYVIFLDGWKCSIRKNLWLYFSQYQYDDSTPFLWIDALCIDQQNMAERNSQVTLMSEIYSAAQSVLVWLGPADHDSDAIMDIIDSGGSAGGRRITRAFEQLEDPGNVQLHIALVSFTSREYWHRTWVIQEFLLARNLLIMCGRKQVSSIAAEKFCLNMERSRSDHIRSLQKGPGGPCISLLKQRIHSPGEATLLELMVRNRTSLCSEPRDKIFALLGLASDCTPSRTIDVDYGVPLKQLFGDVLTFLQVPAKDLFRYAHLLRLVLGIETPELTSLQASPAGREHDQTEEARRPSYRFRETVALDTHVLKAYGYRTGRIVNLAQLDSDDQHQWQHSRPTISPFAIKNLQTMPVGLGQHDPVIIGWSKLVSQLQAKDLRRLQTRMHLLQLISQRSFPVPGNPCGTPPSTPPKFAPAVVLWSGRKSQGFASALTFGHSTKGDAVIQLPGFDVAFTMTMTLQPLITGRVICASVDLLWPNIDERTSQEFKYQIIHSPADCTSSQPPVHFCIATSELLELVR